MTSDLELSEGCEDGDASLDCHCDGGVDTACQGNVDQGQQVGKQEWEYVLLKYREMFYVSSDFSVVQYDWCLICAVSIPGRQSFYFESVTSETSDA